MVKILVVAMVAMVALACTPAVGEQPRQPLSEPEPACDGPKTEWFPDAPDYLTAKYFFEGEESDLLYGLACKVEYVEIEGIDHVWLLMADGRRFLFGMRHDLAYIPAGVPLVIAVKNGPERNVHSGTVHDFAINPDWR
ncbi:MAG: hypothetical protein Q7R39_02880 [Dehalococcoidia bacterium]|nr:hypothetical protein [Dehalococcoidia bacterium]